jgi:3-oxoacyl-(acyl-carrier-protein) synthase
MSKIYIYDYYSISALGEGKVDFSSQHTGLNYNSEVIPVGSLPLDVKQNLEVFQSTSKYYSAMDKSTLYALYCADKIKINIDTTKRLGVFIGTSRGATGLIEQSFNQYSASKKISPLVSPFTTQGNLASFVAQSLDNEATINITQSSTCTSSSIALINAMVWLQAGQIDVAIAGGSEAPLTDFTIAQMMALKIYSKEKDDEYPCKPFSINPSQNSFVLGEGCSLFILSSQSNYLNLKPLGVITSFGVGMEKNTHPSSISMEGNNYFSALKNAIQDDEKEQISHIIAHAPGTIQGDQAELTAITRFFDGYKLPQILSNKWQLGHTLGASGSLSLAQALNILSTDGQTIYEYPYPTSINNIAHKNLVNNKIAIVSAGFGGQSTVLIIEKDV